MRRFLTCSLLLILVTGLALLPRRLPAHQEVRPSAQAPGKILRIGVRRLPEKLSPSLATTDNELRVLDLLFEGLERLVPGEDRMSMFRPALALAPLEVVPPLGRTFRLPANAKWSDGKDFITARNVRESWRLLHEGHLGWSPSYADRLEEPNPTEEYRLTLKLTQSVLEPQAFLRFPILPAGDVTGDAFAKHPVGSGRFCFKTGTPERLELKANPCYASRPGKSHLPDLMEIHFVRTDNPIQALKDNKIDLALDLTPADLDAVRAAGGGIELLPGKGQRASNRRIYFLALNCAKGPLDQVGFRRALARAIPVENLLNQYLRNQAERAAGLIRHQALTWHEGTPEVVRTSPFPRGSWPVDPKVELAAGAKNDKIVLELLYPEGDSVLDEIMKDLEKGEGAKELDKMNIQLKLNAKPPREVCSLIETGQYQIAYYHYDYPDETYWLWPLLGPRGPRGEGNIFRYDDRAFETLLQEQIDGQRDFGQVRKMMHQAHAKFATDVPFIPLWQFDPVLARRPGVPVPDFFDPLYLFADPDRWGWK